MTPYYDKDWITVYCGDCREVLSLLPSESVDSVVTDPPAGIEFMGKEWDNPKKFSEAFVKDGIGKGFLLPSRNPTCRKCGGEKRRRLKQPEKQCQCEIPEFMEHDARLKNRDAFIAFLSSVMTECLRVLKPGGHMLCWAIPRTSHWTATAIEDAGFEIRDCIYHVFGSGFPKSLNVSKAIDKSAGWNITAPATDAAKQWDGWGTALKPAVECWWLCRKPIIGTVIENVLQHGTGALNVDGCRVPLDGDYKCGANGRPSQTGLGDNYDSENANQHSEVGRWPANLIHDGSDGVVGLFPQSDGQQGDVRGTEQSRTGGDGTNCYGEYGRIPSEKRGDSGSAARFFYCAKASKSDRGRSNDHPTVKPVELMEYLVRLITPPGGIVLDPFMGSGSTLKAAKYQGFRAIGIEMDEKYCEIAVERLRQGVLPMMV